MIHVEKSTLMLNVRPLDLKNKGHLVTISLKSMTMLIELYQAISPRTS